MSGTNHGSIFREEIFDFFYQAIKVSPVSYTHLRHRAEEAQARNRVKERNARTRRLIQEGAVLESIFPEFQTMEPSQIRQELLNRFKRI